MSDAWRVNEARTYFYDKYSSGIPTDASVINYDGSFGVSGLIGAGGDLTEQFVSSYRVDIFRRGSDLEFNLSNTSSFRSFAYGIAPDWNRETFAPGGNMSQQICWTEAVQ